MAYKQAIVRCTLAGEVYGGIEIWSTGFWLGHPAAVAEDPTQAAADAIRALWQTLFNSTKFSNDYTTTSVKLSLYSALGNVVDDKTVFANIQTAIAGTASVGKQAPQIALVCSLLSNKARGKAAKGRMFLPGPAGAVDSTGHIATSVRDAMADGMKTFFDGVKASADVPWDPILVSPGLSAGEGEVELMTHLRVGNVYDTQRRRRNGLAESYADRVFA